jgi:hypothetical protein
MPLIRLPLLELLPNTTHRDAQADSTILVLLRVHVESPAAVSVTLFVVIAGWMSQDKSSNFFD